jgi:autotransporter-associated beta strand protein
MRRSMLWTVCATITCLSMASRLFATDGTWTTTTTGGTWSDPTNWSGGTIADGADATADFSTLNITVNNIVNMDASHILGYLKFADTISSNTWTISSNPAGNVLTLQTTVANTTPTITVLNQTATIGASLAGTQGFIKSGSGALALATAANTWTGNAIVNQGTLTVSIGQAGTAGIVLNNGVTLGGNQALSATNFIQLVSGTASVSMQGSSNTLSGLFSGNGTINWTETTVNNSTVQGTVAGSTFGNFGGTVAWGTNGNGFRMVQSTGGGTTLNPFATIDLGTSTGGMSARNGNATIILGAVASSGTGAGLNGTGTSGGSSITYVVGSANSDTTFAGKLNVGGTGTAAVFFTKVGIGTMALAPAGSYTNTGTDAINGGVLKLDFTNSPTGVFNAVSPLGFTGGTLYLRAKAATSSSQSTGNITLNAGGGNLVLDGNGGSMTMSVLALPNSGSASASTLNISTLGTTTLTTTTNKLADGSYSARITYGSDWATTNSVASPYTISGYTAYTSAPTSGSDTTNDRLIDGMALTGSYTTNQLKIATTQNGQAFNLSGSSVTLTAGGLLFAGSNDYQITNGTLQTGISSGNDLILHQLGSSKLTINSVLSNGTTTSTLTKAGSGTLVLGSTNTYTGASWLEGGVTSISSNANLGDPATGARINMTGGTLQSTATFALDNSGLNARSIVIFGGGGTFDVTSSQSLTVSGSISNVNTSNLGPLVKTGPGTLVLTGANTYTGATIIRGGVLSTASLANGNTTSGIGNSPAAGPALVLDGGTLQYTGPGASTDRSFTLTPNGGAIDASGSGPLVFSATSNVMLVSAPVVTSGFLAGSGARLLTLTGTNTGQNIFAGQIVDGAGGATSLSKAGPGWWTLSNNNTYSGSTTVNGGTLTLSAVSNNNIASSTLINVGANGFLDVTGLNGATLALAASQTLTGAGLIGGSIFGTALSTIQPGTVASGLAGTGASNISGGLTLAGNASLNFGLNGSNGTANTINVGGALALPGSGAAVIVNLYTPNSTSPFAAGPGVTTYDLFQFASLSGSLSELSVGNANSAYSYSFGTTTVGDLNFVNLSIAQLAVAGVWSTNGSGNWSSPGNWSGGVPQNAGDTATFASAITSPAAVTLDQPETVGSVTFNNTASYTISGTNTLSFSTTSGATINDTLGSHFIAVPLNLATNVGALVSNGATLTLFGVVSGTGSLTKNGNGTLVLSSSNGYGPAAGSVGTTLNAGTVRMGNSTAFSTGDVTVAGNSTIQAGANGLSLGNNFIIASSATATFDTQGNMLTVTGLISESAPSGSLSVIGTGTLIVTASNSYTGTTTITAATLQLDNGGSSGYVAGAIVDNGTFALNRGDTALVLSSVISGTGSLSQVGSGMSTLTAANTFSGQTTISAGTLQLANSLALQNSTLNFNNPNGTLSFGTLTAASVGGLTGSLPMALQNDGSAALALTVGGNGVSTTYGGNFSGPGSLAWNGPGSWTLTGSSNIAGALQMSQNNGLAGGGNLILPAGSLTVSSIISYGSGAANLLTVSGGSLNVSGASSFNSGNGGSFGNGGLLVSGGLANLSGGLNISTDNKNNAVLVRVTGGTLNSGAINLGRTALSLTTQPTAGSTTAGLYITAGNVNVAGAINVGTTNANTNSSASVRMDGGTVNVSGSISIGLNNGGRWSVFDVNGGSLVVSDTVSGVVLGGPLTGDSEFLVRAGVANVPLITFGQSGGGGTAVLNLTGGQLYVGAGGLVYGLGTVTPQVDLAGGTLGATAPWASAASVPITLTGGSATGVTIQTADASSNPQYITLGGAISGGGAMTVVGGGTLELDGNNSYTGFTNLQSGLLLLGNAGALQDSTLNYNSPGGVISFGSLTSALFGGLTGSQSIALFNSSSASVALTVGYNNSSTTYSGNLSGDIGSALTKVGTGRLTLAGTNSYAGGTTIGGGILVATNPSSLGDAGGMVGIGPGTLEIAAGYAEPRIITLTDPASTIQVDAAQVYSVSGTISGFGALNKTGSGELVLTASNNYSGGVSINGGTLQLGNAGALGTGPLAVNSGVLDLKGFSVTVPSFSGAAGVVTNGASGSSAVLTVNQLTDTTFSGAINNGASPTALVVSGGTLTLGGAGNFTGGTTVSGSDAATLIVTSPAAIGDGGNLMVGDPTMFEAAVVPAPSAVAAAVPEPTTIALLSLGLLGAGIYVRVRSHRSSRRI